MFSPLSSGKKIFALLLALVAAPLTTPASTNLPPALTNWQVALTSFRKAGALLGQEKVDVAKTELSLAATNLPAPYGELAARFRDQLDAFPKSISPHHRSPKELLA